MNPLGALLARFLGLGPLLHGLEEVRALRDALDALEGQQLAREIEWRETKDQVMRHLKRVQAVEGARKDAPDPTTQRLLELKFGARHGGQTG